MPEDTDFGFEVEEQEASESDNLKEVRTWGRKRDREAKAAAKEAEALKASNQELTDKLRNFELNEAAREKGLSQEQIDLLKKIKPDAGAEHIDAFIEALGPKPEASGEEEEVEDTTTAPAPSSGFRPMSGTGGGTDKKVYDQDKVNEFIRTRNTKAFEQMVQEVASGRADLVLKWDHYIPDSFDFS